MNTQNKLILLGLLASTILILGIAIFAIIKIQDKLHANYNQFGQIMTKTLAVASAEVSKDTPEFDKYKIFKKESELILKDNNDLSFIEFRDKSGNVLYSTKSDNEKRAIGAKVTVSSPMVLSGTNELIGSVVVGLSGETIKAVSLTTRNSMLVVFALAWLVFTIVILVNSMLITRELMMLQQGVKNISTGQFGYKIDDKHSSGEIKELFNAFNDMSTRLHLYEEQNVDQLSLEKNKMEAVLMSIANGVVACDNFDNVVMVNSAAKDMLEVDEKEILGTKIQQYCDTNGELCFKEKIEQFKDTPLDDMDDKPLEFNIEVDGKILKSVISPMFTKNQDYTGYIIVLIDVTKEVEVAKLKSDFISNVSHELRTPVTVLRTYADTLFTHGDDFDQATKEEFIEVINKEADRLHKMVNDILDFSRLESPNVLLEKEFTDVSNVVESAIDSMTVLAKEKEISFSVIKEPDLPAIPINIGSIERAMKNLLSNAIKYSNLGGKVKVRIEFARDAEYLEISVEDQGIGIPDSEQKKIFERFYRVENATHTIKGTGLGLHLVKIAIEKHHKGKVFVESKLNVGSKFGIWLPVNMPADEEYEHPVKGLVDA